MLSRGRPTTGTSSARTAEKEQRQQHGGKGDTDSRATHCMRSCQLPDTPADNASLAPCAEEMVCLHVQAICRGTRHASRAAADTATRTLLWPATHTSMTNNSSKSALPNSTGCYAAFRQLAYVVDQLLCTRGWPVPVHTAPFGSQQHYRLRKTLRTRRRQHALIPAQHQATLASKRCEVKELACAQASQGLQSTRAQEQAPKKAECGCCRSINCNSHQPVPKSTQC